MTAPPTPAKSPTLFKESTVFGVGSQEDPYSLEESSGDDRESSFDSVGSSFEGPDSF